MLDLVAAYLAEIAGHCDLYLSSSKKNIYKRKFGAWEVILSPIAIRNDYAICICSKHILYRNAWAIAVSISDPACTQKVLDIIKSIEQGACVTKVLDLLISVEQWE